jgi:hypothetical protein
LGETEGWGRQGTSGSARRPSLSQSTSVVPTSELERRVCEHVNRREDDLVALLRALIGFDTVTFAPGAPPREVYNVALRRDRRGNYVVDEEETARLRVARPDGQASSPEQTRSRSGR